MKFNSKVAKVFAKWMAGIIFGALLAVMKMKNYTTPFELTSSDWADVFSTVWGAIVPVAYKWLNPKDELTFTVPKE